jgi:hypothetical protein
VRAQQGTRGGKINKLAKHTNETRKSSENEIKKREKEDALSKRGNTK